MFEHVEPVVELKNTLCLKQMQSWKKQRHKIIIQYPTSFYLLTVNV